jgi:hypothetical protein
MDVAELGTIAAAVGGGGLSVGGVVWYLLRSLITDLKGQVAAMRAEVAHLRDRELADIARRLAKVEEVESNCPGVRLGEKMDNAIGWLKKVDLKLDRIAEDTAAQRSDIAAKGKWLENLDASHASHVRDRGIHHG